MHTPFLSLILIPIPIDLRMTFIIALNTIITHLQACLHFPHIPPPQTQHFTYYKTLLNSTSQNYF